MGRANPVYNGKKTWEFPSDFPFIEHLLDSVSGKSPICNLVSDEAYFVPAFRNTDQLLQIDIKYFFHSYCILVTSLVLLTQSWIRSINTILNQYNHNLSVKIID